MLKNEILYDIIANTCRLFACIKERLIMKCILLCAGYATRLFPLTENFPKALLKVGGKAIIDYTLEK